MMYSTVSPSNMVAVVRANKGPYRRQSFVQFTKTSSCQRDKYVADMSLLQGYVV